jgi:hypothetical protein
LENAEKVKAPWWKRIIPRRKPRQAVLETEEKSTAATPVVRRQHKRPIWPIIRNTIAIILLVGGIVYSVVPQVREWVNPRVVALKQKAVHLVFPEYAPVRAVKATAPQSAKDHPASMAVDGFKNRYWLTPMSGKKMIELHLQEPVKLDQAIIYGGIMGDIQASHRPKLLHIVYDNGKTEDVPLKDQTDHQVVDLDSGSPVKNLEIYIQETHQSAKSKQVAITEIELFTEI